MSEIVLTVADHEQNGFMALARWGNFTLAEATKIIRYFDSEITDETEPDIDTAPFTFILDLVETPGTVIDTGSRFLPLQIASGLAPEQVADWLRDRPDPNSVLHYPPLLASAALAALAEARDA